MLRGFAKRRKWQNERQRHGRLDALPRLHALHQHHVHGRAQPQDPPRKNMKLRNAWPVEPAGSEGQGHCSLHGASSKLQPFGQRQKHAEPLVLWLVQRLPNDVSILPSTS